MFEFAIPVVLIFGGILCLVYAQRIGPAFCQFGKTIWRTSTLGLTDMRWFYPEEKAPVIFRIFGIALILFSIPWGIFAVASVSGPGAFAAMRESRVYLSDHHGSARSWRLSTRLVASSESDYLVTYHHGDRAGVLHATWKGHHYVFSEEKK